MWGKIKKIIANDILKYSIMVNFVEVERNAWWLSIRYIVVYDRGQVPARNILIEHSCSTEHALRRIKWNEIPRKKWVIIRKSLYWINIWISFIILFESLNYTWFYKTWERWLIYIRVCDGWHIPARNILIELSCSKEHALRRRK